MSSGKPRATPQSQLPYIRRNATLLQELPEPGEIWQSDAISNNLADQLVGLHNRKIVRRVKRVPNRGWGRPRCCWETDPDAYELIQEALDPDDQNGALPCGHSAIRNERDVDGITCGVCNEIHPREEVSR